MKFLKNKEMNVLEDVNSGHGIVLEESASALTQGANYGKYSEGANLRWYP